jgi:hypothetical protein
VRVDEETRDGAEAAPIELRPDAFRCVVGHVRTTDLDHRRIVPCPCGRP